MTKRSLIIGMGIGELYKKVLTDLGHEVRTVDSDPKKNADSLIAALDYFNFCSWDKNRLISNSIRFSPDLFKSTVSAIVNSV